MRQFHRIARWLLALGPVALCSLTLSVSAQSNESTTDPNAAGEDKKACIRNLKVIYDAIQLYQMDHKEVPNWLSDLVPQYLDASALICPACKRTGQTESSPLADPKLPCSYLYEFCPVPLGKNDAPGDPTKTRRDWKRRQMALAGGAVPIVRCRHHDTVLNLAFDGHVYESGPSWEDTLNNGVDVAELQSARIFAVAPDNAEPRKVEIPPRDASASPRLINLDKFYNATLTNAWHGKPHNDLTSLPSGLQTFAGVQFDVRGIVQLASRSLSHKGYPSRVTGMEIHQKCSVLHFLHAVGYAGKDGQLVGSYVVHYANNQMESEIPIIYGRDVRDWHKYKEEEPSPDLQLAWTGTNGTSSSIRLYTSAWTNIVPNVEIDSIDFVSAMGDSAPFLIAITTEGP
ncbi:MAG TPA: hypothetical protein VGN61_02545 [Verrucomicrobiae bacterium]